MLDYLMEYSSDQMKSLVDAGAHSILALDRTWEQALEDGGDYSVVSEYVEKASKAGFQYIHILAPSGSPSWTPEDWFMRNEFGDTGDLKASEPESLKERFRVSCHRILSYWNPEAQEYLYSYINGMKAAIEPAGIVIASFGSCGEFFFPSDAWLRWTLKVERKRGPWYFDPYAITAWQESGIMDQETWWRLDRMRIIRERLSWSTEPWLSLFEFYKEADAKCMGTIDISRDILRIDPRPERIMFEIFPGDLYKRTRDFIDRYDVWAGAKGTARLVLHAKMCRDENIRLKGLICGPTFERYENKIDQDTYDAVAEASKICG